METKYALVVAKKFIGRTRVAMRYCLLLDGLTDNLSGYGKVYSDETRRKNEKSEWYSDYIRIPHFETIPELREIYDRLNKNRNKEISNNIKIRTNSKEAEIKKFEIFGLYKNNVKNNKRLFLGDLIIKENGVMTRYNKTTTYDSAWVRMYYNADGHYYVRPCDVFNIKSPVVHEHLMTLSEDDAVSVITAGLIGYLANRYNDKICSVTVEIPSMNIKIDVDRNTVLEHKFYI